MKQNLMSHFCVLVLDLNRLRLTLKEESVCFQWAKQLKKTKSKKQTKNKTINITKNKQTKK